MKAELHPLLLVPGMLNDERVWRHQVAALNPRCSEILVVDTTTADSIEEIARQALQSAPAQFSLAGFSLGGIVALEMFRQAPQRVLRLALLGSTARTEKPHDVEARQALMQRAQQESLPEFMKKSFIPRSLGTANRHDSLLQWEILDMGQLLGIEVYLRQCLALNMRRDYRDLLGEIHCPSLVICGEEDQVWPAWISEQLAQAIPGSDLLVIKGCGHMVTLEASEEISAALLNWLKMDQAE